MGSSPNLAVAEVECQFVSDREQDTPAPVTGAGQAEQGATVQEPLKAAPADKDWLQDMESIRSSGAPGDFWLPRRTEER